MADLIGGESSANASNDQLDADFRELVDPLSAIQENQGIKEQANLASAEGAGKMAKKLASMFFAHNQGLILQFWAEFREGKLKDQEMVDQILNQLPDIQFTLFDTYKSEEMSILKTLETLSGDLFANKYMKKESMKYQGEAHIYHRKHDNLKFTKKDHGFELYEAHRLFKQNARKDFVKIRDKFLFPALFIEVSACKFLLSINGYICSLLYICSCH